MNLFVFIIVLLHIPTAIHDDVIFFIRNLYVTIYFLNEFMLGYKRIAWYLLPALEMAVVGPLRDMSSDFRVYENVNKSFWNILFTF